MIFNSLEKIDDQLNIDNSSQDGYRAYLLNDEDSFNNIKAFLLKNNIVMVILHLIEYMRKTIMNEQTKNSNELSFDRYYIGGEPIYEVSVGKAKVSNEVHIPSTYKGLPVKIISRLGFENAKMSKLTIPDTIITIERAAFKNCENLISVSIPKGVKELELSSFYGCKSLIDATLHEGLTSIGENVFYECEKLKNITIPSTVKLIDTQAFYGGENLTSIVIPSSVNSIASYAFCKCYKLKAVYYLGTPTQWNNNSFENCFSILPSAKIYFYSKTKPTDTSYHYWHYVNGKPTIW